MGGPVSFAVLPFDPFLGLTKLTGTVFETWPD